jgi:hypothetical protein
MTRGAEHRDRARVAPADPPRGSSSREPLSALRNLNTLQVEMLLELVNDCLEVLVINELGDLDGLLRVDAMQSQPATMSPEELMSAFAELGLRHIDVTQHVVADTEAVAHDANAAFSDLDARTRMVPKEQHRQQSAQERPAREADGDAERSWPDMKRHASHAAADEHARDDAVAKAAPDVIDIAIELDDHGPQALGPRRVRANRHRSRRCIAIVHVSRDSTPDANLSRAVCCWGSGTNHGAHFASITLLGSVVGRALRVPRAR